jgi:hypothetical protein
VKYNDVSIAPAIQVCRPIAPQVLAVTGQIIIAFVISGDELNARYAHAFEVCVSMVIIT